MNGQEPKSIFKYVHPRLFVTCTFFIFIYLFFFLGGGGGNKAKPEFFIFT